MLPKSRLGQGLEVSAIGRGCMGMSHADGSPDDVESAATIDCAIELGCTFLDTAEASGPFQNEERLGRGLKGERDQVVIATKCGFVLQGNRRGGVESRPGHRSASGADAATSTRRTPGKDRSRQSALSRRKELFQRFEYNGATSKDLEQKYPRVSDGAKVGLSLGWGWEPHWTYAESDHATTPEH